MKLASLALLITLLGRLGQAPAVRQDSHDDGEDWLSEEEYDYGMLK